MLTNVAPQTLFMMNSEFVYDNSRKLAETLLAMKDATDSQRMELAYIRVLNRRPNAQEIDNGLSYIKRYANKYPGSSAELSGWQSYCHILIASDEFVYLD